LRAKGVSVIKAIVGLNDPTKKKFSGKELKPQENGEKTQGPLKTPTAGGEPGRGKENSVDPEEQRGGGVFIKTQNDGGLWHGTRSATDEKKWMPQHGQLEYEKKQGAKCRKVTPRK